MEATLQFVYDCWSGNTNLEHKEYYRLEWFAVFHKSIRQVDFYSNCKISLHKSQLTPAKDRRRRELRALDTKLHRAYGFDNVDFGSYDYYELKKKYNTEHQKMLSDLRELDRKFNQKEDFSINGSLDSILYNLIHLDEENFLYEILEETFEEHQINVQTKK